jgi:hypothetical protein
MTDNDNAARLLRRYVQMIQSRFRGNDQLDEFCGMPVSDRNEIRRIANTRGNGTGSSSVERTGATPIDGRPEGGWFEKSLAGLPRHDDDHLGAEADRSPQ